MRNNPNDPSTVCGTPRDRLPETGVCVQAVTARARNTLWPPRAEGAEGGKSVRWKTKLQ